MAALNVTQSASSALSFVEHFFHTYMAQQGIYLVTTSFANVEKWSFNDLTKHANLFYVWLETLPFHFQMTEMHIMHLWYILKV